MPRKIKMAPVEMPIKGAEAVSHSAASSKISLSCLNEPIQISSPLQSDSDHVKEPSPVAESPDKIDKESTEITDDEDMVVKKSSLQELFEDILHCSKKNLFERLQNCDILEKIVDKSDEYRSDTLLHKAAEYRDSRSCELLLGKNAKKNALNNKNQSPLHVACQTHAAEENAGDDPKTVRCLLCDEVVTQKDANGLTPLHLAAMRGNVSICEELFKSYADTIRNVRDSRGRTALHTAVIFRKKEVVEMLLRNEVHPDALDGNDRTPLHEACYLGLCDIAKCIVCESKSYWENTETGSTFLKAATRAAFVQGHINIVQVLQENTGASLDHLSLEDLEEIDERKFSQLMEIKFPFDKQNPGWTVLHYAAKNDLATVTEKLLSETDHQRQALEEKGETPLTVAVRNKSYKVADMLLEYGAPPNSSDNDKNTPLHIAIKHDDKEMVKKLLAKGADTTIKNSQGLSSVNYAVRHSNQNILVTLYKKSKFNFEDVDNEKNTLLHTAAISQPDGSPVTQWLAKKIEQEAKNNDNTRSILSKRNGKGHTPEIAAARNGKPKTVKLFVELHPSKDGAVDITDTYEAEKRQNNRTELLRNAMESEDTDTVNEIMKSKDWCAYLSMDTDDKFKLIDGQITNPPPLRRLFTEMPDCAMDAMWKCIYIKEPSSDANGERMSKVEPEISFDFRFIDDTYTDYKTMWGKNPQEGSVEGTVNRRLHKRGRTDNSDANHTYDTPKKTIMKEHPMMYMIRAVDEKKTKDLPNDEETEDGPKQVEYFRHPLILASIRHMFGTTFWIYSLFLLFYTLFILMLSAYMLYARRPHSSTGQSVSCANASEYQPRELGLTISTGILAAVGVFIEAVVIYHQHDLYWWGNALTWLIYGATVVVIIPYRNGVCAVRSPWQWQIGIFTVLLAWLNGLYMLRRFPVLGLYVTMVQTIFKTFAKFAIIWFFSVGAFAVPYRLLFYNQHEFDGVWISGMKTAVMAFGEFDYSAIFHSDGTEYALYDTSARIIFFIFIVLMTIMIMNLLIALAVDDVSKLQKRGRVEKLKLLVELTLSIQLSLPHRFRKENTMKIQDKFPGIEHLLVKMEKDDFSNENLKTLIMANKDKCSTGDVSHETNKERHANNKTKDQEIIDPEPNII